MGNPREEEEEEEKNRALGHGFHPRNKRFRNP
jgi:hypothetical protein